jgi:hypothetical protein
MRKINRYGRTLGAVVVELRRGSVHHVDIGPVKWHGASANIIGGPLTWGAAEMTIDGKAAKELAAALSDISIACHRGEIGPAERATRFDEAIRAAAGLS